MKPKRVIISRADSIGDVMLTFPMAGFLKERFPGCHLIFLGRSYTRPVIEACEHVDEFMNWDEISGKSLGEQAEALKATKANAILHVFPKKEIGMAAKEAGITLRVGTARRVHHLFTCNRRLNFTRKRSDLHESQLNFKLLEPFGLRKVPPLSEIKNYYGFESRVSLAEEYRSLLSGEQFNLILHPKSKGSATEWGLRNFDHLIELLPEDTFRIFITGTQEERKQMDKKLPFAKENVYDLAGKLSLEELIGFIDQSDGLVASSTGPLHIAAALGKHAIGLYSPKRPVHPGRWAPLGEHAQALVFDENCEKCRRGKACGCIRQITPEKIVRLLSAMTAQK